MAISDISLGDFSAENDVNLSDYFVEDTHSYKASEDIGDPRYILVGRTGSGKSAILSHINNKFKEDKNYICVFIRPEKSYLDAIVQTSDFFELKKVQGLEHILYKLIWQYVIMIAVLREKYGLKGPLRRNRPLFGKDLKAYKFLNKVEQLSTENQTLADIIINLLKEINLTIQGITVKAGNSPNPSYEIMRNLIKETESFHDNGFWDVVGGAKLYLLFDDLDLGWNPKDKNQQMLLSGLFKIMKDYVYRKRVKPLIALRTNILYGLELPQKEKFENNILRISWTKPNLERMLLLRFQKYMNPQTSNGFNDFFVVDDSNNPVDYMVERTLYRPRDLLAFCKSSITEASKFGLERIRINEVLAAESAYAFNRTQALADEWKYIYPKLDLLVKLLVKIARSRKLFKDISTKALRYILVETKERILTAPEPSDPYQGLKWFSSYFPDDKDPTDIVHRMFKLGILGYRQGVSRYTYAYELDKLPDIDNQTMFSFHPMLENLSTSELSFGDENPWL